MSKWIEFVLAPKKDAGRKTDRWIVKSKDSGYPLGEVRWFGAWRKYAFYPDVLTVYEQTCLRDIAAFIEQQTKLYNQQKKGFKL